MIGSLFAASVLTAIVVSLLLPKIYESTTTLLPQLESKDGGGLGALLAATGAGGAVQGLGISMPGAPATQTDIFVVILKSRIMADEVIKRFNLLELFGAKRMQGARKTLDGITKITVTKEKVIKIVIEAKDPQLAADIANFYVSNLDQLNRTLNVSRAGQNRAFIEKRLAETQVSLVKAEEALKDFQTKNKTVAVETQSKTMMEAAAMIQGQIMAQEVQLQVMSGYLSPDNPELSRVRTGIGELKKQLAIMSTGKGDTEMPPGTRLHPAIVTVPGLALDYGRLLRELKVQETLYALLTSQYEQAKLSEARDTPTVQVLDSAIPAEEKSKPSIRQNVMMAGVSGLLLGVFLAFFLEYLAQQRAQVQALDEKPHLEIASSAGNASESSARLRNMT